MGLNLDLETQKVPVVLVLVGFSITPFSIWTVLLCAGHGALCLLQELDGAQHISFHLM